MDQFSVLITFSVIVTKYLTNATSGRKGLFWVPVLGYSPPWRGGSGSRSVGQLATLFLQSGTTERYIVVAPVHSLLFIQLETLA